MKSGWTGHRYEHGMASKGIRTRGLKRITVPSDKNFRMFWGNLDKIRKHIRFEMHNFLAEDIEFDDGRYQVMTEVISDNAQGSYMPVAVADYFDVQLPKNAKDVEGNPVENWADYEFAWEELEEVAEKHADFLNKKLGMKGQIYFGFLENIGDYGMFYIWEDGDEPNWEKLNKR